jgi:glycosyltransferase involved in cell wall biosynthesis
VIAPQDDYSAKLEDLGCVFYAINVDRSGANLITELQLIKQLTTYIHSISPDCLINFTPKMNIYGVVIGKALGIKVINSIAGLGAIFSETGFKPLLGKMLLRLTQPMANHIIFQNEDDKAVYLQHHYTKPNKCSRVKGIGIDLKQFVPTTAPNDNVVRFIVVARMLKTKGIAEFVAAAEQVDDYFKQQAALGETCYQYEFSLLGFVDHGNPQSISLSTLQEWHDTTIVNFLGQTDDVFNVVKDYDCVVLPSYYREGIPQCLIEACAMAKPIITTNNVGCKETVDDQRSGFIVSPQCVNSLSDAMIKMIKMPHAQRIAFGKEARLKAKKEFCHIGISTHYLKIIDGLLDGNLHNNETKS